VQAFSGAHYTFADPQEFTNYQYDSGLLMIYPFTPRIALSLEPVVYHKRYKDFFEGQTGIERVDSGARVGTSLTYQIKNNMQFSANLNYARNVSTLDNNSYEATSVTPSLQFSYRF